MAIGPPFSSVLNLAEVALPRFGGGQRADGALRQPAIAQLAGGDNSEEQERRAELVREQFVLAEAVEAVDDDAFVNGQGVLQGRAARSQP